MVPPRDPVRVLHLDDDAEVLEVTGQLLESRHDDLSVEPVRSTADALEQLDDVDCVLADYVMPGMDGAEFLTHVRRARPALPVVFFTGRDADEIDDAALETDLTAHVRKGIGANQYETLAERIVDLADAALEFDTPVCVSE